MCFSGVDSKDITFGDPDCRCIRVQQELYDAIEGDCEKLVRVLLDTPLMRL